MESKKRRLARLREKRPSEYVSAYVTDERPGLLFDTSLIDEETIPIDQAVIDQWEREKKTIIILEYVTSENVMN